MIADMPEEHRRSGYLVHGRSSRKTVQATNSLRGQLNNKLAHVESVRKELQRLEKELKDIQDRLEEEDAMRVPDGPSSSEPAKPTATTISTQKLDALLNEAQKVEEPKEKVESPWVEPEGKPRVR